VSGPLLLDEHLQSLDHLDLQLDFSEVQVDWEGERC
jgi:hypothetical protein